MNEGIQASIASVLPIETVTHALHDGLERTKVALGDVRERADVVVHERPLLAAAVASVVGVGLGVLVARRLERWLVVGVGGAALRAFLAPTLKRLAGRPQASTRRTARA